MDKFTFKKAGKLKFHVSGTDLDDALQAMRMECIPDGWTVTRTKIKPMPSNGPTIGD
jgi:hypothetical protein